MLIFVMIKTFRQLSFLQVTVDRGNIQGILNQALYSTYRLQIFPLRYPCLVILFLGSFCKLLVVLLSHKLSIESISLPLYSFGKKRRSTPKASSQEMLLFETDSCVDASQNSTILSSSCLGSVVIYSLYLRNFHFLLTPLNFISHVLFSNTLLSGSCVLY